MDAQTELQKVSSKKSSLATLSGIMYFIGGVSIFVGVIIFIVGLGLPSSFNNAPNFIALGIGIIFLGFSILFFGAIGKAVNDIRNCTIADFNLRHSDAKFVELGEPDASSLKSVSEISEKA